ncbi:MAG: UDP-N-acetylmuramoyl-L-alanine--D-glutamate ligase [Defluviitaleaceae bacterium]|nr:UDP-N-acetylmuramoyl-L-alanine--D-glutamate ligase [Defluviitaleaceae bacterium]
MVYQGKKALVCGMGLSGAAAARLLLAHGASVTLCDLKPEPDVDKDLLDDPRVLTNFGKNPDEILGEHQLMVLSPGIPTDLPFVEVARQMGMPVWGEVELAARHCAAPIMAVTGTNGKTTVCSLAGQIMQAARPGSALAGNIGHAFCGLAESLPEGAWAVAEISSFQLETIDSFRPKISCVINMTPDHLNRHKTMENYVAMKERIFENQQDLDYCILNFENKYTHAMAAKTRANVIFFSKSSLDSGVFVRDDAVWVKWQDYDQELIKLRDIPIPGGHNAENIMAAAAMCMAAGVTPHIIAEEICKFRAVEHRLEYVLTLDGVGYYNDSKATNVDSAVKAILSFDKPIVLISGGQDKDLDYGELIKTFPNRIKTFVVLGEVAEKLIETCRAHNYHNYERVGSMKEAVSLASSRAVAGDVVLLSPSCASYDMFDNYEQRGRIFKNFVKELG